MVNWSIVHEFEMEVTDLARSRVIQSDCPIGKAVKASQGASQKSSCELSML